MWRILISISLSLCLVGTSPAAFAQAGKSKTDSASSGTGKRLSVIVFAGVAGAILGLSTLSFYGRPQDKLNHIAVGAAVGIIGGAVYSTFKAATEPRDFYNLRDYTEGNLLAMQPGDERGHSVYTPKMEFHFSF
ncbi:MAG: hypothetical protein KF799_02005 [Bdellovibrionales bacterium]|nr:hypothetical protein [Bdellovibrionales bacterium]